MNSVTRTIDGATIVTVEVRAKPSVRERVEAAIAGNYCLIDGPGHPATRRGLSDRRYFQYRAKLMSLPKRARVDFEAKQIKNGRLLPNRQGQRIGLDNPFEA